MSMKPLTGDELAVFGHDAVRLPDGSVQERGIGSAFHRAQIKKVEEREAKCRGIIAPQPQPASTPPPSDDRALRGDAGQSNVEPRTIDARLIHPIATSVQ
jgi:hypothetical protein